MGLIELIRRLDVRARILLVFGVVLILGAFAASAFWFARVPYRILFAGLAPEDAAVMMAELDKQKIPYKLENDGTAILVPEETVHKTRIRLLGQNLPLHGAVGFELFNNSDFGMTEFAQKVNYQRALQGEITRTILSLSDVQSARVLLALPEQGLFRKPGSRNKASITLGIRDGAKLSPEQVLGIQRLVSAAVPDIATRDVVIADQHGVALTYSNEDDDGGSVDARLGLKRATESYLAAKANQVLDHTFGPGVAVASVDVTLNMDRIHITREDAVPYSPAGRGSPTGVVVRDRRSTRESDDARTSVTTRHGTAANTESETEYQAGKRIEQIMSAPGSITHLSVTAVVNQPLNAAHMEQIKAAIGNAVGLSSFRGDTVVVVSANQIAAPKTTASEAGDGAVHGVSAATSGKTTDYADRHLAILGWLSAGVLVILLVLLLVRRRGEKMLTPLEREQLVKEIRAWIAAPAVPAEGEK